MKTYNVLVLLTILTISSINSNNPFEDFAKKHGENAKQSLRDLLYKGKEYYKNHKHELKAILEANRDKVADFILETNEEIDVLVDQLALIIGSLKNQKNELLQKYAQKLKDISARELVDRVYAEAHKGKDF
jgi:hypothetical protein